MFKYVLQIIIGIFSFALSAFIAWYEGSAIIDHPWDWKYSTPFSTLFQIELVNGYEISQLDYFVYAAKYQPLFPMLMLLSLFYILTVFGFYLIKHQPKWGLLFWSLFSCTLLVLSGFLFNASTFGGYIFFWMTFIMALGSLMMLVFLSIRKSKNKQSVTSN